VNFVLHILVQKDFQIAGCRGRLDQARVSLHKVIQTTDRLCGLVVRVLGYRSGGPGSIPGTAKKKSSGSGTGSTQLREYN
jgi:hypothetical protein